MSENCRGADAQGNTGCIRSMPPMCVPMQPHGHTRHLLCTRGSQDPVNLRADDSCQARWHAYAMTGRCVLLRMRLAGDKSRPEQGKCLGKESPRSYTQTKRCLQQLSRRTRMVTFSWNWAIRVTPLFNCRREQMWQSEPGADLSCTSIIEVASKRSTQLRRHTHLSNTFLCGPKRCKKHT